MKLKYHGAISRRFPGWEFRVYVHMNSDRPALVAEGFAFRYKTALRKQKGLILYLDGEITHQEWIVYY